MMHNDEYFNMRLPSDGLGSHYARDITPHL